MAIPDFQQIMLPLLELLADGELHQFNDVRIALEEFFHLTEKEKGELLPSGIQPRFANRVGWARTHLGKAGLVNTPQRGIYKITERGQEVLKQKPAKVDLFFLDQFAEHVEFRKRKNAPTGNHVQVIEDSADTPKEALEKAYLTLRSSLSQELLDRIKQAPPGFFEKLVVGLLLKMGYGGSRQDAGQAIGRSGDGGIDGIIKEDKLGLDVIYLQAKRWEGTVGRPVVQAFAGSLEGHRARKGVLITTSNFSADAKDYVSRIEKKIVLIDGQMLSELMIDHDLGVAIEDTYIVRRIDFDYFSEE
jgi:restriction system protein